MQSHLECLSCFCRQALDAVRFTTDDAAVHEEVLRKVLRDASEMDLRVTPPMMGRNIHRVIRIHTGNSDPYREVKKDSNRFALQIYPDLKQRVAGASDPLEAAVRLAIAGNVIDFGANPSLDETQVARTLEAAMEPPLFGDGVAGFRTAVEQAKSILYLGDNAGEIVLDRLLIEQLPADKITYVVKASPIINDATMRDAHETGLTEFVEVIDNGSDAPGTILELCSEEFRNRFHAADMIVAKGQANYETLSDVNAWMFFLLMGKCPVITRDIGCELGSFVLLQGRRPAAGTGA